MTRGKSGLMREIGFGAGPSPSVGDLEALPHSFPAAGNSAGTLPSIAALSPPRSARPIVLEDNWRDRDAWDGFIEAHEQSRFCHLFDYGEVVRCYGYEPIRLGFVSDGQLVAALPASLAQSLLFGCKLVSQPFSEYGGLLLDPSLGAGETEQVYDLLSEYLACRPKIRALEMHGSQGIAPHQSRARLVAQNPHHVAILPLGHSADALWNSVVEYSVRKGVNKAIANDVEVCEESSEAAVRERFFPLYLRSMKRLGAPPHSLTYFMRCREMLDGRMKIFWARRQGDFLAGLLGFTCGQRVNIVSIVSDEAVWKFSPNDAVHWSFIKWANESGFRFFDFGSVRYEGQRIYKNKWGAVFEEHAHYFLAADPSTVERATFDSSSPRMSRLAELWSEHMPDRLAQLAGPVIRKQLVR